MPSLLRKLRAGVGAGSVRAFNVMRRAGKLARSGCRGRCCDTLPRFIKVVDCCDPASISYWIDASSHCADGRPIWTQNGPAFRFLDTSLNRCSTTIPNQRLTRAEVVAADPNATFRDTPVGGWPCLEGGCNSEPCTCPSCCASARINSCGPMGPGANLCCECGAHFTLRYTVLTRISESQQFQAGVIGSNPGDCHVPLSSPVEIASRVVGLEIVAEYLCDAAGNFIILCRHYSYSKVIRRPEYQFPDWYLDPNHSGQIPGDGWAPTLIDQHEDRCEESGCENNRCGARLEFSPQTACGLDQRSASDIADGVAAGLAWADFGGAYYQVPGDSGWAELRGSTCAGDLDYVGQPWPPVCPGGAVPHTPHMHWNWNDSVECRRGRVDENYTWEGIQRGQNRWFTGFATRAINWTITRHERCQQDPCGGGLAPLFERNSVRIAHGRLLSAWEII